MKVAIPVENTNENKYTIAPRFNENTAICIYDSCIGEYSWMHTKDFISNEENISSFFQKMNLSAIITSIMQPMALSLFTKLGIQVYKSDSIDLIGNIQSFEQDELHTYTAFDAFATASLCGDSCASCSSKSNCTV